MEISKLELLRTLNFIVPKLPETIKHYRLNFSNSSNLIKNSAVTEIQYKDKSYIFIISVTNKNTCNTLTDLFNLKAEEIEKYPFLVFIMQRVLKGLIEIDLLFNCLAECERENNYPKFYKNQISFIINYVKHEITDLITSKGESIKGMCYGLSVDKEDKTFCKLLVTKCFIINGVKEYVVCLDQDNDPYPYKKELTFLEAEAYFPLTAIH